MTRLAALALALALLGAGCGAGKTSAPQQRLTDLRGIGQLRSLFNTRSGEPRLIVLVSPT
jgi:hypothetical protein